MCVAVKANAYGHGVEVVLPALRRARVEMLGVATIAEARQLRDLEWSGPILLFGSELSACAGKQKSEQARWLVEKDIRVTLTSRQDLDELATAARAKGRTAGVHFKLDSGMSRMGVSEDLLVELLDVARADCFLNVEGLYTHFATADDDMVFAGQQLQRFRAFVDRLRAAGVTVPMLHAANSAAIINLPDSHLDMIRPGISVYGYHTSPAMTNRPDLRPAMRVVSYLTLVKRIPAGSCVGYGCTFRAAKDMLVGLVPIGYADGYNRRLSNAGKMIVADRVVPVVGRVSMDQTVIDLTALDKNGIAVSPGTEVIVIDNDRDSPNSVEALAVQLGTIPYEITTLLGPRVTRVAV
jgi:alanine racemase